MVGLREAGLSYRDIAARTGHAATTVMRAWNQWREEGADKQVLDNVMFPQHGMTAILSAWP